MAVPTQYQLIEAVKIFMDRDVVPAMSGRTAFHARIASNVLAIVMRELLQRTTPDDTQVCADIRSGALDENSAGLLDNLLANTMAQVAIDNPKYTTHVRMKE